MINLKKLMVTASAIAVATVVSTASYAETVMEKVLRTGELVVAVQTQGPPISFMNAKGVRTGLAIELIQGFADEMGVKLVLQNYDWKGLIPALKTGKADVIAADMTPTAKRHMQIVFTDPVFFAENVIFTTKGKGYKSWRDLNNSDTTIAAGQGTTYADVAKKLMPNAKLKEYAGSTAQTVPAVLAGRADAGVSDRPSMAQYVAAHPELVVLDEALTKEPLGFATRPDMDSMHMLFALNNYFRLIKHNGELGKKLDYWWNSTTWMADHK